MVFKAAGAFGGVALCFAILKGDVGHSPIFSILLGCLSFLATVKPILPLSVVSDIDAFKKGKQINNKCNNSDDDVDAVVDSFIKNVQTS